MEVFEENVRVHENAFSVTLSFVKDMLGGAVMMWIFQNVGWKFGKEIALHGCSTAAIAVLYVWGFKPVFVKVLLFSLTVLTVYADVYLIAKTSFLIKGECGIMVKQQRSRYLMEACNYSDSVMGAITAPLALAVFVFSFLTGLRRLIMTRPMRRTGFMLAALAGCIIFDMEQIRWESDLVALACLLGASLTACAVTLSPEEASSRTVHILIIVMVVMSILMHAAAAFVVVRQESWPVSVAAAAMPAVGGFFSGLVLYAYRYDDKNE